MTDSNHRPSVSGHRLLLLRHAKAADFAPGRGDAGRPLTEVGLDQVARVAEFLADKDFTVDRVLASSAVRTKQTAEGLSLDGPTELFDDLYNAGSETIAQAIGEVDETVGTLLVVGHAPGIPTLAHELAGEGSDPGALQRIDQSYPTATLSVLTIDGEWASLLANHHGGGRLTEVLLTR